MAIAIIPMALEFDWSSTTQGFVLSSFFVGYLSTQIIGGVLSDRFGGKWVLSIAAALWTIFTFLTPIAAKYNLPCLILCRIFLGIGEGACLPCIHSLIAVWFPPEERSRAVGAITASGFIGIVVAMPISSLLIASSLGWESSFWTFGLVGCIWSIAWHFLGASSPINYPGISEGELSLILKREYDVNRNGLRFNQFESGVSIVEDIDLEVESSRTITAIEEDIDPEVESSRTITAIEDENTKLLKASSDQNYLKVGNASNETLEISNSSKEEIPWKLIFSRREIWAILVAQFCNCLGYYIMLNWLPTYYSDNFGVDIKNLGYFMALPNISQGIMGFVVGIIGDYLINELNIRVITVRRGAQIIGGFGLSIFLLISVYLSTSPIEGILLITIGCAIASFKVIGVHMVQLDIAPKYAGVIWGIGNTSAVISGMFGVALTGLILDNSFKNWDFIWNLIVLFYLTGTNPGICIDVYYWSKDHFKNYFKIQIFLTKIHNFLVNILVST
ncbi:16277_t:CDS:2 [Cetraspora pellucida]|uniref:16277_t:CDS:1 n=1 Tax=Cetraspora pellucida TaxID=1433469 RepID=A0A9N9IHG7_9GLOM|nr:16277_t:CDS:2 [Cetraspora pellucida]